MSTSASTQATSSLPVSPNNGLSTQQNEAKISGPTEPFSRSTDTARKKRWKKIGLIVGSVLAVLLVIVIALGVYTYSVTRRMQSEATVAKQSATAAYASFKAQDLITTKTEVEQLAQSVQNIKSQYSKLRIYRYIPIARSYYLDGEHALNAAEAGIGASLKSINAIEPYADVLGFSGEGSFQGGSAENRIKLIIETLDKVLPEVDSILVDLETAQENLSQITPDRYPEELKGMAIGPNIIKAQDFSTGAVTALTEYRPVLEKLPSILGGNDERKKYIILFQNDNELRPTGGFLTAYAIIYIENGVVTPEKSDDIYELDQKYRRQEPIPEELGRYLTTEKYWNLRDMNIDPDFKLSMDKFFESYQTVPGEPKDVDGIIAIDTEFVTNLLKILGPVEVPGYGTFSAENDPRCDCPQIIYALSEIITKPTPYLRADRKGILGPLMRSMLTKAYGAPRQQWPELFDHFFQDMAGRHLQLYFIDPETQQAAEVLKAAGRLPAPENTDFFAVVNANLAGAKSNLFVTYEVKQSVAPPENGKIIKDVEITYKNPRHADNCNLEAGLLCLNSTLRDWTRIYVPAGSELIKATGFSEEAKVYQADNGLTVIDGFFILEPKGTAKIKLTYSVPYADENTYKLAIWKQGGIDQYPMLISVDGDEAELLVDKDREFETSF